MAGQTFLESELGAFLTLDHNGAVSGVGRGCRTILGWKGPEVIGAKLADLCVPEHQERFSKAFRNLSNGAPSAAVHARFERSGFPKRMRFRIEQADEGYLASADEVADASAGGRGFLQAGAQLQSLVDGAADTWLVHDLDGNILEVNAWGHESLGYTREELLRLKISDIETTIQPGRLDGIWNRMEVGKPVTVEGRQKRKDGTTFPVEVRLGLFVDEHDELLMLAVARDITARKRDEKRLNELNLRFSEANEQLTALNNHLEETVAARTRELASTLAERQAIMNHLADGLIAVDDEGSIRVANPSLTRLLDLPGEVTGGNVAELPGQVREVIRAAERTREVALREVDLTRNRVGVVVASPVEREGQYSGVVALVRDVTLEKEVDRMKTEFIATVSHELRTPLTSVLGFTRLVLNRLESRIIPALPTDDAKVKRAVSQVTTNLEIVMSEGARLTNLINDLLDISKMESGRMEWDFQTVEVDTVVRRATDSSASLFVGREVELVVDVEAELPRLQADPDRIQQVLVNLLSNAAKFTDHGSVTLAARRVDDTVELSVTDTGGGIAPDDLDAVFDRFRQVGDTLTNRPKGTGLGLSICREIVAAHGGRIWVESDLGVGTTFRCQLPLTDGLEPISGFEQLLNRIDAHVRSEPSGGAGGEILVVDDDAALRELLRQQLEGEGYVVREAHDGYDAIVKVRERRPDLVVLDVMMPQLSGFDVAALLKSDPQTESIPIIILSIIKEAERGFRVGVDRYFSKPADPNQLSAAIDQLIHERRSPRRVLIVDEERSASSEIVRLLESRGFHIVARCTGEECLDEARRHKPELIVVESLSDGHPELVRTIRLEKELEHILVVQMVDQGG